MGYSLKRKEKRVGELVFLAEEIVPQPVSESAIALSVASLSLVQVRTAIADLLRFHSLSDRNRISLERLDRRIAYRALRLKVFRDREERDRPAFVVAGNLSVRGREQEHALVQATANSLASAEAIHEALDLTVECLRKIRNPRPVLDDFASALWSLHASAMNILTASEAKLRQINPSAFGHGLTLKAEALRARIARTNASLSSAW